MSPDGTKLFAANTPNGALEIFDITPGGLSFRARAPVGMEPVAAAPRSRSFASLPARRALAVSPDKNTIYVAGFKTGNQTSVVIVPMICQGFKPHEPRRAPDGSISPGGNPGPRRWR